MTVIEVIRWVCGIIFMGFGIFISLFSPYRTYINYQNNKNGIDKHMSMAPILGTSCFVFGYFSLPISFSYYTFLILFIDWDTVLLIIYLPFLAKELLSKENKKKT